MKYKYLLFILILGIIGSCKPELDEFTVSAGSADFSIYVAVGNSLTAGFADGELTKTGQMYSFPNMLSGQFALAGGGAFKQALMKDDYGFGGLLVLGYNTDCLNETSLGPIEATGSFDPANLVNIGAEGPYNNMGIPGAKSFHLVYPGYGTLNPYYARFAADPITSVAINEAVGQNPSFFTLWIGNNDVLSYALTGGAADSVTGVATYTSTLTGIVQALTGNGAKGAIANIPDITSIPMFTTIPYNGLVLTDQTQVDQLNAAYQQAGAVHVDFQLGQNAFLVYDPNHPAGFRHMTEGEYVLLTTPQDSLKCAGWGSMVPLGNEFTLIGQEVTDITNAINDYNALIANLADQYGLALVDVNLHLNTALTGVTYDGITFTAEFVTGGLFSLDGVHLNPQGYAIVANFFIDAINEKYGATLPHLDITEYPGVIFP